MPCISCGSNAETIQVKIIEDIWLSREEVKLICEDCYNNMIVNNISRIKKSALVGKIDKGNDTMLLYEVMYQGPKGSKFNFGGHTLEPDCPKYFSTQELPFTPNEMKKISHIKFSIVELKSKPVTKSEVAKATGSKGVMWVGMAAKWTNEFGTFTRNDARHDLSKEAVEALRNIPGFKVIE